MEWWKLFSGTFVLIFLAELGDKTQLAAMAKTADAPDSSSAKWVVFLAASLALAASTFIAVFLGHILKSFVPDERYIRLAAAVLFLVFGITILYETIGSFRNKSEVPAVSQPVATAAPTDHGLARNLTLRAAMDFESLAMKRYRDLAATTASPQLAALLTQLADEEEAHFHTLQNIPANSLPQADSASAAISDDPITLTGKDEQLLHSLIQHEEATAAFYHDLATRTLIPSIKSTLASLSRQEAGHAARLRAINN